MTDYRREKAKQVRNSASQMAYDRVHPTHKNNGDEQKFAAAHYAMSFTKGLKHDLDTGLVEQPEDFETFRSCIDAGFAEPFTTRVPVPEAEGKKRRPWEAPTAGVVYELQGPDPQAVTMSPAPSVGSDELAFEMAEVYELALLRDTPFEEFSAGTASGKVAQATNRLKNLPYASKFDGRPRKTNASGVLTPQTVFRGSSPGVDNGPYISQFLLMGTGGDGRQPEEGFIPYGAQVIDQRVLQAEIEDDYMLKWQDWHEVQQGFDVNNGARGQAFDKKPRFIYTPRDLATYVHIDQLYQAYLNACLLLLDTQPFDPAFNLLSGKGDGIATIDLKGRRKLNAGGFALWGGPHILSLVTEVATRALKAVRYQKFNNHIRLRPEALAARIEKAKEIDATYAVTDGCFGQLASQLAPILKEISTYNLKHPRGGKKSSLLPMAFAEGSPMHPAYGAGHATVAGACVTILKAFFDTSAILVRIDADGNGVFEKAGFMSQKQIDESKSQGQVVEYGAYVVAETVAQDAQQENTYTLKFQSSSKPLTLEGELNKLAANISIGRNMAGVHYFSDYYDSVRMGEKIAIGILEEQALCYTTDPFVMSLPTFDGDVIRIGER